MKHLYLALALNCFAMTAVYTTFGAENYTPQGAVEGPDAVTKAAAQGKMCPCGRSFKIHALENEQLGDHSGAHCQHPLRLMIYNSNLRDISSTERAVATITTVVLTNQLERSQQFAPYSSSSAASAAVCASQSSLSTREAEYADWAEWQDQLGNGRFDDLMAQARAQGKF